MAVVKTIANSWCASYRYHETLRLTCLFGCAARDDQVHYLQCTQLWQAARAATGTPDTQDPLVKLVVGQPSEKRVCNLAVAFYTYHSVKRGHLAESHLAKASRDLTNFAELVCNLARLGRLRAVTRAAARD